MPVSTSRVPKFIAPQFDIVVFEVMAEQLDRQWWEGYRRALEARFRQEEILIRGQVIQII